MWFDTVSSTMDEAARVVMEALREREKREAWGADEEGGREKARKRESEDRVRERESVYKEREMPLGVHGSVFGAESQEKGRGRGGRKWVSPKGGSLYFTIIFELGKCT